MPRLVMVKVAFIFAIWQQYCFSANCPFTRLAPFIVYKMQPDKFWRYLWLEMATHCIVHLRVQIIHGIGLCKNRLRMARAEKPPSGASSTTKIISLLSSHCSRCDVTARRGRAQLEEAQTVSNPNGCGIRRLRFTTGRCEPSKHLSARSLTLVRPDQAREMKAR